MRFLFLLVAGCWLVALPAQAQKAKVKTHLAKPVKGGAVATSQGQVLLFNHYKESSLNFSLTFAREAEVQATDHPGLYTVNGQPLQVLAVPAASFAADSAGTTISNYVQSELGYLLKNLPAPVEPFAQLGSDKQTKRLYAVWGFPLPEGYNQQVLQQVFVTFLDGGYLINISSNQLKGQEFDQTLQFLFAAAHSYQSSPEPIVAK